MDITEPKLFFVMLGGRTKSCHIEQHDIRWVVGKYIEETFPLLRKEWFGLQKGLHIDSYLRLNNIDGYIYVVIPKGALPVEIYASGSGQCDGKSAVVIPTLFL